MEVAKYAKIYIVNNMHWKRFVLCQMLKCIFNVTVITPSLGRRNKMKPYFTSIINESAIGCWPVNLPEYLLTGECTFHTYIKFRSY